jgi:hypothetical protein
MATIIREVLTSTSFPPLTIWCAGMTSVGVALTGTWTGSVAFLGSTDGLNFKPITVTPFPQGTGVQSAAANGNFYFNVANYRAFQIKPTVTTGSIVAVMGVSLDSSYQDAYLAPSSKYVSQETASGAATTITIAAQANRAWRLRTLSGGFSAAPGAAVKVTVSDGGSTTLWEEYLSASAGGWQLKLPTGTTTPGVIDGGVVNTPGNSLVITVAAPGGSVTTAASAEIAAA